MGTWTMRDTGKCQLCKCQLRIIVVQSATKHTLIFDKICVSYVLDYHNLLHRLQFPCW